MDAVVPLVLGPVVNSYSASRDAISATLLLAGGAPSPFNKPNADVVLRSLDGVEFRVRSHILIEASPWFEAQLSPLPTSSPTHLAINAHSAILEILLRICYPIPSARTQRSIKDLETALGVAAEYQLELPIVVLEEELLDMARRGSAVDVWAFACRMNREDLGRRAVQCTFDDDDFDMRRISSLQGISAGDYYRFREYRRLRGQVSSDFVLCKPSCGTSECSPDIHARCSPLSRSPTRPSVEDGAADASFEVVHRPHAFTPDIPDPDLVCVAADGLQLPVHRLLAAGASSVIRDILSECGISATPHSDKPTKKKSNRKFIPPEITVAENSTVLACLFQLCYPGDRTHTLPANLSTCLAVLEAAGRLGMPRVGAELEAHWRKLAQQDPLRAYLAAVCADQRAFAEEAAKYVVNGPLDAQYVFEMETTPALPYHLLATYYDRCRAVAKALLRDACIRPEGISSPSPRGVSNPDATSESAAVKDADRGTEGVSEVWLQAHLHILYRTIEAHPGQMPPGAPEALYENASISGQWCRSCEGFAQQLSSVARALRGIPTAVGTVKFHWT